LKSFEKFLIISNHSDGVQSVTDDPAQPALSFMAAFCSSTLSFFNRLLTPERS
jgi:hypothetical protein